MIYPSFLDKPDSFQFRKPSYLGVRSLIIASMTLTPTAFSNEITDPRKKPELLGALARILSFPPRFCALENSPDTLENYYKVVAFQVSKLLIFKG